MGLLGQVVLVAGASNRKLKRFGRQTPVERFAFRELPFRGELLVDVRVHSPAHGYAAEAEKRIERKSTPKITVDFFICCPSCGTSRIPHGMGHDIKSIGAERTGRRGTFVAQPRGHPASAELIETDTC